MIESNFIELILKRPKFLARFIDLTDYDLVYKLQEQVCQEIQHSKNPSLREVDRLDIIVENLQDLLQTADLVKFAKVEPPANVHDKFWMDAVDIVEKTKMKPRILFLLFSLILLETAPV